MNQEIHVDGMTCEKCAKHVKSALLEIAGVRDAKVDLTAHSVLVESEREVARAEFATAIDRAGYELR